MEKIEHHLPIVKETQAYADFITMLELWLYEGHWTIKHFKNQKNTDDRSDDFL